MIMKWRMWGRQDWHDFNDPQFLGNKRRMTVLIAFNNLACDGADNCGIDSGSTFVQIKLIGNPGYTKDYCTRHSPIQVETQ